MKATSLTSDAGGDGGAKRRLEPDSSLVELFSSPTSERRALSGSPSGECDALRLTPREPPGRVNRKARAYTAEIVRLHDLGYSLDAIREALADAGVNVSRSTVQREATRPTATKEP
jgi:hypothetical protein